ncbi:MAG TPA: hypothetical protein VJT72_01220 [Pseudonocardiaceae bacterium]|nr:hypothetical protein [Pseudonocardiaceae bacterium]
MSDEDQDDELATQYVLARRLRPDLDGPALAQVIMSRLSEEQQLRCAQDALAWAPHPGDRRELALCYVLNFVLAMETDPEE